MPNSRLDASGLASSTTGRHALHAPQINTALPPYRQIRPIVSSARRIPSRCLAVDTSLIASAMLGTLDSTGLSAWRARRAHTSSTWVRASVSLALPTPLRQMRATHRLSAFACRGLRVSGTFSAAMWTSVLWKPTIATEMLTAATRLAASTASAGASTRVTAFPAKRRRLLYSLLLSST